MATAPDDDFDLADAYAVETPEDNRRLYERWAATYESGFMAERGYVYHEHVAELFLATDPDEPVLDVGCGTGVVGAELASGGVDTVDGIDISPAMLEAARDKQRDDGSDVYRHLIEADLTEVIPIADDTYGSIISVGTFTHGHLGPDAIDQLLRIAAPGARFALGVNGDHFEAMGYADWFEASTAAGRIEDLSFEQRPMYTGGDDEHAGTICQVALFRLA